MQKIADGLILADWYNSMADFYRVAKHTDKTVWLQELSWNTCSPPEGADFDPTWRYVKIDFDENGEPILEKDQITDEPKALIAKRLKDGLVTSCWDGCNHPMRVIDNPKEAIFHFYWG